MSRWFTKDTWQFLACVGGLQASSLTWGVMQEELMSHPFDPTPRTPSGIFPSATFCVFSNRLLAIIVAYIACKYVHGTVTSTAPLLAFTPCSLSNTISSWSQYKALNYVTFSMQTIFKSTKVIPVMLMGTFMRGISYGGIEYAEAVAITAGVGIFSFNKEHRPDGAEKEDWEEYVGFALLCSYVLCDAFTSQWQSKLYVLCPTGLPFISCLLVSLSLSYPTTALCLYSLTRHGTSLTINQSINHQSSPHYSHLLVTLQVPAVRQNRPVAHDVRCECEQHHHHHERPHHFR